MAIQRVAAGLVLMGCLTGGWGCVENNGQGKTYLIRHAGISLVQATEIAEKSTPGRAVKAELQRRGNIVVYVVDIVDIVNHTRAISVDAETGKVMP
jgi:uncharacterized membrane protein YkoI